MGVASFESAENGEALRLIARGAWTLEDGLASLDRRLREFTATTMDRPLSIDMSEVERLDTVGAMMLQRVMRACGERAESTDLLLGFRGTTPRQEQLLIRAGENMTPCDFDGPHRKSFLLMLERLGRGTVHAGNDALSILSFVGAVTARLGGTFTHPQRFRLTPMVHHMEEAGLDATPIVGLMSFLIGAVVAFMGARVLASFGASVFTVELVGIAVLREFGVLLTAILVAGRSGSAFTAQIGSMKLREEIDAMEVMGIHPLDALVVPRTLALMLTLPVLAFIASFLGVLGGGVVGWLALDIPPTLFMARMQEIVVVSNLMVGLVKAPFFAFAIAVVGCYHGMQVANSAEDLGRRTTMSVVQSLFLVILIDALFAMFFLELGI
ncbi:ABC transporter permease [Parvularcula sp. LCG005]|uniref:MlaE family ABC transporter permease n=1 Tax=Parvularcula sp. LCG005 TaxID=3078805 RepID=UPI002942FC71|nr:ABC transporter permease [Parvularcula sp. LCG005]WOI54126.1 ABC transporter permease [Parvularcula sp. LCG005]